MSENKKYRLATRIIHEGQETENWDGSTLPPIYQTAAHVHDTAESLSETFAGTKEGHIYSRLSNPTNAVLENKLALLEGGKGAVVTGSGMAAITNACMTLLRSGDNFVSGRSLFMSTGLLFTSVFQKYNIEARLVPTDDPAAAEAAIDSKTRFLFLETIGNPGMDVPDIRTMAEIAHKNGIPLIVDNTLATPFLFRPIEYGADIVVHSTTKYLSGHGSATGGAVIDAGQFNWATERFSDFEPFVQRKGDMAYLDRLWREHHINFGTTQSPFHSWLTVSGLNTLAVRMERHLENARKTAEFLRQHPAVAWVNFPGLSDHPFHGIANEQFAGNGFGAMLTFGLKNESACGALINNLEMIYHLANLGDCKTLIIHPWSTQYVSFTEEGKEAAGIPQEMLRLSVGIEDIDDICEDLDQALRKTE